jgi:hypothetical protein
MGGEKYFAIARDVRTGTFDGFGLELKSDMTALTVKLGESIRKKYGPDHAHLLFRTLLLDSAGEQKCPKFKTAMLNMQGGECHPIYNDPSREQSKSEAELAVKALELRCKRIMLEMNLPITWWRKAYDYAILIANLYPLSRNVKSRDGDTIRPLEELSAGRLSRRYLNKILRYFCLIGSVARISDNSIIGSDIKHAARYRWGIAWNMIGDVPVWMDPFKWGTTFCSKDYTVHDLKVGENCFDFFGLKQPALKIVMHGPDKAIGLSRFRDYDKEVRSATKTDSKESLGNCDLGDCSNQGAAYDDLERLQIDVPPPPSAIVPP